MADKKIIGKLENIITFSVNKASLNQALASIKKIKEAMNGISKPIQAAQKPMQAMKKMKSDYLIVQKQLDKTEKSQLKTAESLYRARDKQALAEQKIANQRRAQAVRGLTAKSGAGKASQTAFADILRGEGRQSVSELKRQRELNRAHTQAIIEDRKRTAAITNKIANDEFKAQKKLDNQRNAQQAKAVKFDRRAQATQEWFGTTFGRGGQRKATSLYNDLRAGKINAEQYSMRLRTLRGDLYRSQRAQRGFNQSIHDMRGAFVQATASYTAFAGVMGISNIGKQYEAQKAQMLVATGSREQAASQLEYLRSETYRLGLGREQASQGYSQIAMAGQKDIGVGGVNKVFTGLSELATATKLEPFKYEKVVNAMAQMLSKQQIYSEELEL